jgi:hypothetical protein
MVETSAFIALSTSYGTVSRFIPGLEGRDMFLSYAREVPDVSTYGSHSYWMAGGFAARLQRAGLAMNLIAPGQHWLSEVSKLDEKLTRRKIITTKITEIPLGIRLFAKPAEAKIESIPAGEYFAEALLETCRNQNVPEDTLFQWTDTLLNLNHEHRFFVSDGHVRTGSPYLIDGQVYSSSMTESPYLNDAYSAAEHFLRILEQNNQLPPALTLDVGRDEDSGEWLIIEANPAWSSGPYEADPSKILKVLERACSWNSDIDDSKWLWKPAQYLVDLALKEPLVRIVSLEEIENASGIFKHSEKSFIKS